LSFPVIIIPESAAQYQATFLPFSFKVVDARIDACCGNSKLVFAEFPASPFKSVRQFYTIKEGLTDFDTSFDNVKLAF